jgi:hypothetical protein
MTALYAASVLCIWSIEIFQHPVQEVDYSILEEIMLSRHDTRLHTYNSKASTKQL